jgi:hypothetical protein
MQNLNDPENRISGLRVFAFGKARAPAEQFLGLLKTAARQEPRTPKGKHRTPVRPTTPSGHHPLASASGSPPEASESGAFRH